MADYRKMYFKLFNAASDAVAKIKQQEYDCALSALIKAQRETEDLFIETEPSITVGRENKAITIKKK